MLPVARWIHAVAERAPSALALQAADGDFDYAAFARRIDAVAAALASAGIGAGERVAWLGLNSAGLLATLFACAARGAILAPLNWRLAPPEHRALLERTAPALLVAEEPWLAACAEPGAVPQGTRRVAKVDARQDVPAGWQRWDEFVDERSRGRGAASFGAAAAAQDPRDPQSPLLLSFTSGSTGEPKGVLLSHRALAANADASVDMHALSERDRVLTTLPLFHVGGLNIQTLPALRQGCRVTLHPKFDADAVLDAIERERITLTVLVPAQLEVLLAHPRWASADLTSLRLVSTGSTVVPRRLIDAVHARGVPIIQVWGATETSPVVCCQREGDARSKAGSGGRAAVGAELRIVAREGHSLDALPAGKSGEVLVRGPQVMNGYWHDAAGTAAALAGGWFRSGDCGHLDAEGFLWIDGRLKDMIISGGENVSPAEVEAVLLECAEVAEAAVVGAADPRWGEAVVAVVAPRAGERLDTAALLASFNGRLARFKQPREVIVVEALPRTALGKVRKEDVRQLVARLHAATDNIAAESGVSGVSGGST